MYKWKLRKIFLKWALEKFGASSATDQQLVLIAVFFLKRKFKYVWIIYS